MNMMRFSFNILILCVLSLKLTADDSAYTQSLKRRNPMSAESEAQQRQLYNQGNQDRPTPNWQNNGYTNPDGGVIIQNYYDPDYPYYNNVPAYSYVPQTPYGYVYPPNGYVYPPNGYVYPPNGYVYPPTQYNNNNSGYDYTQPKLGVPMYGR